MLPYQAGVILAERLGVCVLCRSAPIEMGLLCQGCDDDMVWLPPAFEVTDELMVQSATFYDGAMAGAIGAFKDHERLDALPLLVHAIAKLAELVTELDAVILPIPTTHNRLIERGFYPVGILAQYLSQMSGLPLYQGVTRPKEGEHQRYLDKENRLNNLMGAFVLEYPPPSDTVILFDDVSTTGATFAEVAGVLWADDPTLTICGLCLAHGSPN